METKKIFSIALLLVLTLASVSAITETIYLDDYELKYTYSGAEEDDIFTLTIELNNTGNQKEEVIFEFDEEDPFEIDSSSEWIIGTLEENGAVSQSFRVDVDSSTDEGNYDFPFILEDSKEKYEDELEIAVSSNLADLIIGDIKSSPSVITSDQNDIKLEVTIENIGGGDATFVKAEIILPEGFEKTGSYSDFINLGSIDSGDSKTATFFIDTLKTVPEDNQAEIILNYKSDSDKKSERLHIDLPVKTKPSFNLISSQISPSRIFASSEGTLKISIANRGERIGEETSIRIFENTDIPLEFSEKTKFIGDLSPGESGSAVFPFVVKSNALTNSYLVKVQVRTVSSDSVLTEGFNVAVQISKEESIPLTTILLWAIAALFILILIMMWILRR